MTATEHPERLAAKERLRVLREASPDQRDPRITAAVHDLYEVMGRYPLSREAELARSDG